MRRCAVLASLSLPLLLTGCALTNTASPVEETGLPIQGRVHGGQQPVVGAHVYLLAANTTGYPTATTGASKSLLTYVHGVTSLDISSGPTNGFYYVTTDSNGGFSISGDYSCTSAQQVYLYVVGGNPGAGGDNSAAGFLTVLGNCPSAGNFASTVPFVSVNEVTTVAAAYSMSAFAYDALHVSSPSSARSQTNIRNAFANASNIADISSGAAYSTLPNGNGAGAPYTVNTLANILASCVNTDGPTSNNCATLFTLGKTNGLSGTAPTDTATAAINIAHNQGSNASALFGLLGATQPFSPSYTTAPADFAVPIRFTSPEIGSITGLAVDSLGDIWLSTGVSSSNASSVNGFTELSPQGVHLTTATNPTFMTSAPRNIMVSAEGNVWGSIGTKYFECTSGSTYASASNVSYSIVDFTESSGSLYYLGNTSHGNYLDGFSAPGTNDRGNGNLVVDGQGNFWANYTSGTSTLAGWTSSRSLMTPSTSGYSIGWNSSGLAVDQNNNIWIGTASLSGTTSTGEVLKLSSSGTVLASFTDPSLSRAANLYVDGANTIWAFVSGSETMVQLDTNGNQLQSFGRINSAQDQHSAALDGSGNLWVNNGSGVYQLIGIATPVVTPIAANLVAPYSAPASKPN